MTEPQLPVSVADHDTLQSELAICCRQLQSKEQALKILKQELDLSRERADHSRQEIAQLRSQLARTSSGAPKDDLVQERERFIAQLEGMQERIADLERQLQMDEDEKEELLGERDYFSSQCSALKKCLEERESAQPPSQSALQTLAEENRQLKLQLVEVQAERDQAQARVDRYKRAVERRKTKDTQELQSAGPGRHNSEREERCAGR
jgi:chromosome segregation ATPase